MMNLKLPQGIEAALIKNVNYNIAGLFVCSDLLLKLIDMVEKKFEYTLPIKYIYGSPKIKWNGGRLLFNEEQNIDDIKEEIEKVLSKNITPLFTFSNNLIVERDLYDEKANDILKIISEYECEVIVVNNLLKDYIKSRFTNINIHASVILDSFVDKRDVNFYKKMSSEYYSYVVHPDDNFDFRLLNNIPKNNAEILINERCNYLCGIRSEHYETISYEQKMNSEGLYCDEKFLDKCSAMPEYKQFNTKNRTVSLSVNEIKKLSDIDYKNFKLQGRTDSLYVYFFDILRYTLDNEIAFPIAYSIFSHYIEEYLNRRCI